MKQKIIATVGPPLSGKSTFCGNVFGYARVSFASPLYAMLGALLGDDVVNAARGANVKGEPLPGLCGKSLREGLQTLGTEWGREMIGHDLWINHLFEEAEGRRAIAVDDLRFPDEYEALRARGAVFVRMLPYAELRKNGWEGHKSESHWRTFKVHHEVRWDEVGEIVTAARNFDFNAYAGTAPTL